MQVKNLCYEFHHNIIDASNLYVLSLLVYAIRDGKLKADPDKLIVFLPVSKVLSPPPSLPLPSPSLPLSLIFHSHLNNMY